MSRTTIGVGNVVASQTEIFAAPTVAYQQPGMVRGVIYCHGATKIAIDQTNPLTAPGEYPLFDALRQQYCVGMGDFDFDAWGNDAAMSDVDAMRTWMQTTKCAKSGKVALVGASMGSVTALNYALAHPNSISCVALLIPAVGGAEDPGFATSWAAAYPTYNAGTDGPTHDPLVYATSFPSSIPVHLWYSTGDTTAKPQYVTQFVSACSSASGTVVSTSTPHGQATIEVTPISDVLSFLASGNW